MKQKDMLLGTESIIDAIENGRNIDKVFIRRDMSNDIQRSIFNALKGLPVPIVKVPIEKLDHLTTKNHNGAIAFLSAITYQNIEDIIPTLYEQGKNPLIIALDGITDAHQFGAIARTAYAANVDAIVLPARGGAFANTDAINASAGYLKDIPVCRQANIVDTIKYLKDSGLSIISLANNTQNEQSITFFSANYKTPATLVFGNDIFGISNPILRMSDNIINIPTLNNVPTLTTSIAASIVIYEAKKQREQ